MYEADGELFTIVLPCGWKLKFSEVLQLISIAAAKIIHKPTPHFFITTYFVRNHATKKTCPNGQVLKISAVGRKIICCSFSQHRGCAPLQ
jgi:hypothetical protein